MKKLVIMPGGFHPFHTGHMALYNAARAAFPSAEVYVAATADTSTRKFPFEIKEKLARLSGVPAHRFIQVKNPFRAEEITQHFDPNETQLIFVRSEKDRNQEPQAGGVKKDGSSSYLQPYKRNGLQPMSQHGYMAYLPVVQFGPGMTSATEIRAKWPDMTPDQKGGLVNALYPQTEGNDKLTGVTIKLLDAGMGADIKENFGGSGLVGAPVGSGAQIPTSNMPNGPDDVTEQTTDPNRHMIKQVFQSGKDFVKHLNSMPDSELQALYQARPEVRELMKKLHAHVNEAMQSKVLDAPSHQASDYMEEN